MVSGLSAVSNSFVSPYTDSFVSQSGWWCPALAVSNSCVSPCGNPFVSQSGWWCSALCASRSPCGWWCPALAMSKLIAARLWQFICLPVWLVASGFLPVSIQLGWWCPGLRLSPIHLFPLAAMHLSPSLASGVRLLGCLQFMCLPCGNSFVSQSGWWCPAFRLSPIHLSPHIPIRLSPSLAGGVRLWLSPIHVSPLVAIHLSPSLAGGVRLSARLDPRVAGGVRPWLYMSKLIAARLWQFICLPVWLVASGFLLVSIQLGWWCPGLRLSPIHLFPLVAMHLSPSLANGVRLLGCLQFIFVSQYNDSFVSLSPNLAGGVRLFACLQFMCLPLWQLICLPVWLVVSGSLVVSKSFVSPCGNSFVFDCGAVSSNSSCLPLVSEG